MGEGNRLEAQTMRKDGSKTEEKSSDEDSFFDDDDDCDFDDDDDCEFDEEAGVPDKPVEPEPPKISKRLLQLKELMGLDELKKKVSVADKTSVATEKKSGKEPLVVVYEDPRKRKKAKKEVQRLGITAIKGKASKEEAKIAYAVSLGALPPKNKPVNYKEFQQQRKKDEAVIAKHKEEERVFIKRVSTMAKKKDHKNKNKNKVINFDSKFGKMSGKFAKKKT